MAVMPNILELAETPTVPRRLEGAKAPAVHQPLTMKPWLRAQSINVGRHAGALRFFRRDEFGSGAPAPTEGHIQAVNALIRLLRQDLLRITREVAGAAGAATREPTTPHLQKVLTNKEHAHNRVQAIERIWDFYFELFEQRQSRFGNWLLSCDRIALDCYQYTYLGLGKAKTIPSPPPFSYMRTGFSPATFRRGIPLRRLGQQLNPFPLIQLPYHRLVNPWTLGAVLHEVSHNLHNELGLARVIPRNIERQLQNTGCGRFIASVWKQWNRELFADACGLMLGGPAIVGSLMDIVGRSPRTTLTFAPGASHPTPYLRPFISIELLRRMGFADEADQYKRMWTRLYPNPHAGNIPRRLLESFPEANAVVVDTVCFRPYPALGNKSLSQVLRFEHKEQEMIEEAARRLSVGTDPGIIPERFLIGASRFALDHQLASPEVITQNFYRDLARR